MTRTPLCLLWFLLVGENMPAKTHFEQVSLAKLEYLLATQQMKKVPRVKPARKIAQKKTLRERDALGGRVYDRTL